MPEVAEEREADRVRRRAVHRVGERAVAERPLADAQRAHQGLLVADGALVRVGRDDRDVADRVERLLEREQPARFDAVVVGDEDPRPAGPFAERPGAAAHGARAARGPSRRRRARRAPCRGRAARSGPVPGSCPAGRRSRGGPGGLGGVRDGRLGRGRRPPTSAAVPGAGSRGTRTGRPSRSETPFRGAAGDGPVAGRALQEVEEERRERPRRSGSRRSRPGMPATRDPMRTEPRTTIGWMPTAPA